MDNGKHLLMALGYTRLAREVTGKPGSPTSNAQLRYLLAMGFGGDDERKFMGSFLERNSIPSEPICVPYPYR